MSTASWLAISPAAAPPIPSQTAKSDPCFPTIPARLASSRPRVFRVKSATRKLSSLCSRICPTSVRAKSLTRISPREGGGERDASGSLDGSDASPSSGASRGVSGCVTCGRSPSSYAGGRRIDIEAQELLTDAEVIPEAQADFIPYLQESAVRGAEIGERKPPSLGPSARHAQHGVAAREKRVVGEDDVTGLAPDDGFGSAHVKYVAHDPLDRALAQASIPRCGRCSEKQRPILGRGAERLLRLLHDLEP